MDMFPDTAPPQRGQLIKSIAGSLGFAVCGICRADPIERRDYVLEWLAAGYHGQMGYLERNIDVRLDPGLPLPGARSVIVVGWLYRVPETAEGLPFGLEGRGASSTPSSTGRIARYAWGRDYHRVIRTRLRSLVDQLRQSLGVPFGTRICVDTAPLLERELAQRAGVGWVGNNCMVLNRTLGSYFCLGEVVTTLELPADEPAVDLCGTCWRCLEACPTGALIGPKQMDARRCISYHTIEAANGDNPQDPPNLAGQVYGCDICQQVCPYNGPKAPVTADPDAQARWPAGQIDLSTTLAWNQADWDAATRGRALRRARLATWQRNARILQRRTGAEKGIHRDAQDRQDEDI